MKIIDTPSAVMIEVKFPDGSVREQTFTFQEWAKTACDIYRPFGQGLSTIRQGLKIVEAIESSNGSVQLEDAEYQVLKTAIEACDYRPAIARKCLAFFEAIEKAQDVKVPVEEKKS